MKTLRQTILSFIRRLAGTDQILQMQESQHQRIQQRQHHALLTLGNRLMYGMAGLEKVRETAGYRRAATIVGLLSPMDVLGGEVCAGGAGP